MSIFKDCDIRGIYEPAQVIGDRAPDTFGEASARRLGRALAAMRPGARLGVGGDVRLSTPPLKAALIEGLLQGGADVEDLGTIPTPALYFALSRGGLDGGATVTASHNPAQYNGVKFLFGALPPTPEDLLRLREIYESGAFTDGAGALTQRPVLPDYMAALQRRFGALAPLKVVVDAGNGAMSEAAPRVLRACGCRVLELFCEPDGRFPGRDPNPADYTHLDAVRAEVVARGADFGVAFDGDGDRAAFIDEKGRTVMNEKTLALFVRHLLKDRPTPVVYDQKASSAVRRAVEAMGGEPVLERSGYAFVKRRFLERGAAIAGEVSGHFFFGELGYDDGLFAALTMVELLGRSEAPLSALSDAIVCPPITPDLRVHCPYAEQQDWLDRVEAMGRARGCAIALLDGVRLAFDDGWVLLRRSITAEQMTLRVEAETPERLRQLLELTASALPEAARARLLNL